MISDARRGHVSPGIYTEEKDVLYSVKSLGITSLGLVGETLYGPAFQNVEISNWGEFVDYFGGTSPEKFRKNGNPKYELPYVAKSYLEESKRLNVVRVLGLSGYVAGKPWVVWNSKKPVLVLRSKLLYGKGSSLCDKPNDTPKEIVSEIKLAKYEQTQFNTNCEGAGDPVENNTPENNKFKVVVTCYKGYGFAENLEYNVSLNPSDSDYIYNVIGGNPEAGTAPIYVDALYESSFDLWDDENVLKVDKDISVSNTIDSSVTITSANTMDATEYRYYEIINSKKQPYKVFYKIVKTNDKENSTGAINSPVDYTIEEYNGEDVDKAIELKEEDVVSGNTLKSSSNFKVDDIVYRSVSGNIYYLEECDASNGAVSIDAVLLSGNTFYFKSEEEYEMGVKVSVSSDTTYSLTDFKESYRAAQTPWIVSDAVISNDTDNERNAEMRKLFRFITVSDGNAANFQVKVSIQNIDVVEGTFDVVIRDFNDTDANPIILESFRKCNLVEGDSNYLPMRIGSLDGGYIPNSKYILVEMAEGEDFGGSIPAGFLGFPMPNYGQSESDFVMKYNTDYKPEIKVKRQYFGISNISGIDTDVFTYKGKDFNGDDPAMLTTGFHMDSLVSGATCKVDNIEGYKFASVSQDKVTSNAMYVPRLINANYINETLYADIKTRKFTVCFYGGFDGWDVNRGERTTGDKYKSTRYNYSGSGIFNLAISEDNEVISSLLTNTAITSDYYAYLAGCKIFANPQDIDINLFATPGINWGDNTLLTEEIIDIIEDPEDGRGGDALYIMSSPGPNTVSTPQEAVEAFEIAEINSSYACTYFPWVMYYDNSNKRYINLPVTKDVVKNMASVDNNSFPWFAPAGTERGKVNCVKAAYKTRLSDEDALYEANINPVKSFAQDGVIIWGNKTAYPVETPNNRINVRRMMIRLKKLIINAAKNLIFEQYDEELEKQFRGIVEPILADVKANRGIIDYRVITECTPETRDQHILPAKILVKPVQALEYISISFVVYPESVKFDE